MALKPTIYKARIALTDLNRDHYDALNLTLALHPSETTERMMARLLAFCINAQEHLTFTKGLSAVEEPDIWARSFDEQTLLWIDLGEPEFERVKKSSRLAKRVKVYSYNSKSDTWWAQNSAKLRKLPVDIYQFDCSEIEALSAQIARTMDLSVTLSGDSAYIASDLGNTEVHWKTLHTAT